MYCPGRKTGIDGAIQINQSEDPVPDAGTIRWNPSTSDFEGFDGISWRSLTNSTTIKTFGTPFSHKNHKLLASDVTDLDAFGKSVSIFDTTYVIGAYHDDDNGSNSGSVYIFSNNGSHWSQFEKLTASDGLARDEFGISVGISADYLVVGAPFDDDNGDNSGSIYVFQHNGSGWVQNANIVPTDGAPNDQLGLSADISGNTIIMGAPKDDNGTSSGSAYIFYHNGSNWVQGAKLSAGDVLPGDDFGRSVSISNNTAIIGSPYDDDNGSQSGTAYIFFFNGSIWQQEAKLIPSDGADNDEFGYNVFIDDDYVIVGAPSDVSGSQKGSAYVFHFNGSTWQQNIKLVPSDLNLNPLQSFGHSVGLHNNTIVIGSPLDDTNGNLAGAVYIY